MTDEKGWVRRVKPSLSGFSRFAFTARLPARTRACALAWSATLALAPALAAAADAGLPAPATATAVTAAGTNAGPAPKIEFDSTTFKFEKVKQGEVVKHSFVFTNTGNATLKILEVKPGCGCTTAGEWDKSVEPGKTGAIPLQFNSTGFGGMVSKSATVTCNDPVKSNLVLQLTGNVWRPIDFNPTMATFQMEAEDQTNQTKVVRIISNLDNPVTITNVTCTSPSFKTELKEVKPGKEFDLEVTAVPPFTNTAYAQITIKTSAAEAPSLGLNAYVTVQQQVLVSPSQFMLPAGPFTNAMTRSITVLSRAKQPLRVSEPTLALSGVQVDLKQLQTGRVYTVSATFPAGFKMEPGQRPELTLKTDHPKYPELKIPIYQQQAPIMAAARSPSVTTPQVSPASQSETIVPGKRAVPLRKASPPVDR